MEDVLGFDSGVDIRLGYMYSIVNSGMSHTPCFSLDSALPWTKKLYILKSLNVVFTVFLWAGETI
jgi:hypothetical protein